jgi:hypothetical protein
LRIKINQEGTPFGQGETGREVDRSCGLSDSALLIDDGQRPTHQIPPDFVPRGTSLPPVFHVEHYPGVGDEFNLL